MPQVTSLPKSVKRHLLKSPSDSQTDFLQILAPFPGARWLYPWCCTLVRSQSSSAEGKPGKPPGKSAAAAVVGETMAGCSSSCRWCCRTEAPQELEERRCASRRPLNAGDHIHVMANQQNTNFSCTEHLLVNIQTTCSMLCIFLYFICVQG